MKTASRSRVQPRKKHHGVAQLPCYAGKTKRNWKRKFPEINVNEHLQTVFSRQIINIYNQPRKQRKTARPAREMFFFFAFLVGVICIYYLTGKHFLEVFVDIWSNFYLPNSHICSLGSFQFSYYHEGYFAAATFCFCRDLIKRES